MSIKRKKRGKQKTRIEVAVRRTVDLLFSSRPKWLRTARVDFFRLADLPFFSEGMYQGWAKGWLRALDKGEDKELFIQALRVWTSANAAFKQIEVERVLKNISGRSVNKTDKR